MTKQSHEVRKIEEALIHFHRHRLQSSIDSSWQAKLMSRIAMETGARGTAALNGNGMGRTVWRFALAASFAAIVLAGTLMFATQELQYQVAELILDDSVGMDLAGSLMNL
jgi:anti-sigma-K factor RskA